MFSRSKKSRSAAAFSTRAGCRSRHRLSLAGEPAAMDVADLDGDKAPEILYVARTKPGGRDVRAAGGHSRPNPGRFGPRSGAKSSRSRSPT